MDAPKRNWFKWYLRILGGAALFALPCALMPFSWMNAIHNALGMGQLPDAPVVGYLARSTSMFYAMLGGLFWIVSFDLRRHRLVLLYLALATVVFGLVLSGVDVTAGMPWWWSAIEGPLNVVFGTVIFVGAISSRR